MTASRSRLPITMFLSSLFAVGLLAAVTGNAAEAAPAGGPSAEPTCPSPGWLCLWDGTRSRGTLFTVAAADPAAGTCVDLAEHQWGDGRARSARNTGSQAAQLYPTTDCTGTPYEILPGHSYRRLRFASNSVFVH